MDIFVLSFNQWLAYGFLLNIMCYNLLYKKIKPKYIIYSLMLSFVGLFGLINFIGLLIINMLDMLIVNKTFIKIQNKFFKYIYL